MALPDIGLGLDPELRRESWALVAIPQTQAPALSRQDLEKLQPWGILWKRRGYSKFRWMKPLATSEDQAMRFITSALQASPSFVNRHAEGDFYCIPLRYCLAVPLQRAGATARRELQNLLIEFGLSTSLETALGRVQAALKYGTPWPAKSADWWREKLQGTLVVPVPVHRRVVVGEVPNVAM